MMDRTAPFPGFPEPLRARTETHWCALVHAILFQQLAGAAASAIHQRVVELTPGPRLPTVEQMERLPDTAMRDAGVSAGKLRSIRDLGQRLADGRLSLAAIGRLNDDQIIERLTQVHGIGLWSAQMFLVFRLGRLDVMPATDLAIREGLMRLDELAERPAPAAVLTRAERWAPLRSVAAWHLWRASQLPT